jgi:FtsP/CotA-like multicopper oxidase with cupredoxin domain
MSRTQRLTFLGIAAVIAVIAVVILVTAGGSNDEQAAAPTATPTETATATPEDQQASPAATATVDPGPVLTGAKEQEIDATQGDTVRFQVKAGDEDEEVHVHGYDIEKEVPAGQTITISFKATITGIFEIEFHHSGAVLARLKVEP